MKGGMDYTVTPPRPVPVMSCPICAKPLAEHRWQPYGYGGPRARGVLFYCAFESPEREKGGDA